MYAQVEKTKENKSRAVANSVTQKKSNVKQDIRFLRNLPQKQRLINKTISRKLAAPILQLAKAIGNYSAVNAGNVRDNGFFNKKIESYDVNDEIRITSNATKKFTAGIKFGKKDHVFGSANGGIQGWILEQNVGGAVIIPGRLWTNVPAKFTTKNTVNKKGDSEYTVTADDLERYAPINKDPKRKALNQVHHNQKNRHVAYSTDPNATNLYDDMFKNSIITYSNSKLKSSKGGTKKYIESVVLKPEIGKTVLDFDYDKNSRSISGRHVGHAVFTLG